MTHCSVCDGPGVFMGHLGNLAWFRCQNCGMEFYIVDESQPPCDEESFDESFSVQDRNPSLVGGP